MIESVVQEEPDRGAGSDGDGVSGCRGVGVACNACGGD